MCPLYQRSRLARHTSHRVHVASVWNILPYVFASATSLSSAISSADEYNSALNTLTSSWKGGKKTKPCHIKTLDDDVGDKRLRLIYRVIPIYSGHLHYSYSRLSCWVCFTTLKGTDGTSEVNTLGMAGHGLSVCCPLSSDTKLTQG